MRQEPYALQGAIAEQRRQQLFSEVEKMRQIRNAFAVDPKPDPVPSSFSRILDAMLTAIAQVSNGPIPFGPRAPQRDRSASIKSSEAGQPQ
jgi:hypothetical protein